MSLLATLLQALDDDEQENMIEWTFKELLAKANSKEEIMAK